MMKGCRRSRPGVSLAAAAVGSMLLAFLSHQATIVSADDALHATVVEAFAFSGEQLVVLADDVLVVNDLFTDYTDADGLWITEDDGEPIDFTVWTSGMVAGMFWYQYAYTQDEAWKTRAEYFTSGLQGVEEEDDNDTGFQVMNGFGLGYKLTGDESYKATVLTGADTLYANRYVDNIPAFWSWANPSNRPEWERAVNVDMMMNMEIMLWAAANGGDETYTAAVEGHADTTWKDIVREDNSTFHVADYDPDTGDLVDQGTYQGWIDNSTWSRGQAWAVYGYVMVYRFIELPKYLEYSIGLLEYFDDNLPSDYVPFADFDAPEDSANGKDSSATAIVTSALFELFQVTGDPIYLEKAQTYLTALLSDGYYEPDATDGWQSILRRATGRWGEDYPEVGAVFGDYFFLEAMVRYKLMAPSILLRNEEEQTVVSSGGSSSRRLRSARGGSYCSLHVVDGKVEFEDPDCVPVPPDFADDDEETPAPTVSVSAGETDDDGATPSPAEADRASESAAPITTIELETPSPTTDPAGPSALTASDSLGTPAPAASTETATPVATEETVPSASETVAPTAAGSAAQDSSSQGGAAGSISFDVLALDNDVDLTWLNASATVVVWLGITLENVDLVPETLHVESAVATFDGDIDEPAGGWVAGANTVEQTYPPGIFGDSWDAVTAISIVFSTSTTAAADATNTATVDHLIVGHYLDL